jgi:hypothetical protein
MQSSALKTHSAYRRYICVFLSSTALLISAVGGFNLLLDPFGLSGPTAWPSGKQGIAYLINKQLTTVANARGGKIQNAILGDSRAAMIPSITLSSVSGEPWSNIGYGGATLEEMSRLLDYSIDHNSMRQVLVVLPFNRFTRSYGPNGIDEATILLQHPWKLYLSAFCLQASSEVTLFGLTGITFRSDQPRMSRERFRDVQLEREAMQTYPLDDTYPQKLVLTMHQRARSAGVKIIFLSPPTEPRLTALYESRFAEPLSKFRSFMEHETAFLDYERSDFPATSSSSPEFKDLMHLTETSAAAFISAQWPRIRDAFLHPLAMN